MKLHLQMYTDDRSRYDRDSIIKAHAHSDDRHHNEPTAVPFLLVQVDVAVVGVVVHP